MAIFNSFENGKIMSQLEIENKELKKQNEELKKKNAELESAQENTEVILNLHNEKLNNMQHSMENLTDVFSKCIEEFSNFVKALDKANSELELKRKWKQEAMAEFKAEQEMFKNKQDSEIILHCFNCNKEMEQKPNSYRCKDFKTERAEDGSHIESGCTTKIYDNYFGNPLTKWQLRDLLAGEKVILENAKDKDGNVQEQIVIKLDKDNKNKQGFYQYIKLG